jgi:site-specific recombinase XerD
MEEKIMSVLCKMQVHLQEEQLRELKTVLHMVFADCELVQKTELRAVDRSWVDDLEDYLMSKALEGKSAETVKRYRYELNRLLSYTNKAVANINDADISEYMRTYKRIRKISNQTLENVRAVFSSFFVWLRDRDRIRKNPMVLVEHVKVEKKIKKPFSDAEREKMRRSCNKLRDLAMLEFMYSTAVRVSELSSLNIADIRFGDSDLIVYGKGAKERTVYLNEKTHMYLKEYIASRTDDNPALFVSTKKPYQRLSKAGIEYIIRTIGKRALVENAHPHRFRRTSLTNALNRGMPLQEAMLMAGHEKPETTMRYCNVDQEGVKYHHKKYLSA